MKNLRKALSLLLAVCMTLGMVCMVSAEVTLPDKIFDLDVSSFVSTSTVGSNGAVNAGTSTTASISMNNWRYGTASETITLTKNSMSTATGAVTEYINYKTAGTWTTKSKAYMSDTAWNDADTTFSFWITPNANAKSGILAACNLTYTDESDGQTIKGVPIWGISKTVWNTGYNTVDTFSANDGWNHVAIISKKADADGSKQFEIYVNGTLVKTATVTAPSGMTLSNVSLSFGRALYADYVGEDTLGNMDMNFGKVQAYTGSLTAEQIGYLCSSQLPEFTAFDITKAEKLFDLDISNYSPVTSTTQMTSNSGAVNAGTSPTASINLYNYTQYTANKILVPKKEMSNKNGSLTQYIGLTDSINWGHASQTYMSDTAWENSDTTISFWVTPKTDGFSGAGLMAAYNLIYTDENGTDTSVSLPLWRVTTAGFNTGYNTSGCAAMNKGVFNHIAIVNGKADADGTKAMQVYINGAFYKTVNLQQPSGTTLKNAVLSFDGLYPTKSDSTAYEYGSFNIGGVQVYKGEFQSADIKSLYDMQKDDFTELTLSETEKLLDLNIDGLHQTMTEGSSGITNTGTSETAMLDIYSTEQVRVDRRSMMDTNLESSKPYIYMDHNFGHQISSGTSLSQHFDISDTAWADKSVTVSFWADLDPSVQQTPSNSYCIIAQYGLNYKNADDTTGSKAFSLWQWGLDNGTNYYWGTAFDNSALFNMNDSREWSHVAIVVPNTGGTERNVKLYVNGSYIKTVTLEIPEGAEITDAALRFGGNADNGYLPGDLSIGDVKVYGAVLTEESIKELYNAEKDVYQNVGEAKFKFKNGENTIYSLNGITADGTKEITIEYSDSITPECNIIAASYDENGNFITAKYITASEASGSFAFPILENTKSIKVFTWEKDNIAPIQKTDAIQYNDN